MSEPTTEQRMKEYARTALLHAEMRLFRVSAPTGAPTTEFGFWLWRSVAKRFVALGEMAKDAGGWWASEWDFVELPAWQERFKAWVELNPARRG